MHVLIVLRGRLGVLLFFLLGLLLRLGIILGEHVRVLVVILGHVEMDSARWWRGQRRWGRLLKQIMVTTNMRGELAVDTAEAVLLQGLEAGHDTGKQDWQLVRSWLVHGVVARGLKQRC